MILRGFKQEKLDSLKANRKANLEKGYYAHDKEAPIGVLFDEEEDTISFEINMDNLELLEPREEYWRAKGKVDTEIEIENCKRLYEALKNLTPDQASQEKLWGFLCHTVGWKYMIKRWKIEEDKDYNKINERFMLKGGNDRALVRNGLARLWWMAYTTYDENRYNPYELTEFLLRDTNLQQQIIERSFSRNIEITKAILASIKEYSDQNGFPSKEKRAKLVKAFNRLGGIKMLDMIQEEDIKDIVFENLN